MRGIMQCLWYGVACPLALALVLYAADQAARSLANDVAGRLPDRTVGGEAMQVCACVNCARASALMRVRGVGKVMAQRIIEARRDRLFESVDDLRRVNGVGGVLAERINAECNASCLRYDDTTLFD